MHEWKSFFLSRKLTLSPVDSISSLANFDGFRAKLRIEDRELNKDESLQLKNIDYILHLKDAGYDSEDIKNMQC